MKLHLGCGKRYLSGYTHICLDQFDHVDYLADISTLDMFKDNTVELIYASHVLEDFTDAQAGLVLAEWYRVLMPGGIVRLAVPDFEALVGVYHDTHDLSLVQGSIYGVWTAKNDKDGEFITRHNALYDFDKLAALLKSVGFKNPTRWDWRKVFVGEYAGFDDYSQAYIPHMDKENGKLVSLNVEATK